MKEEIISCHICGASEKYPTTPNWERNILFILFWREGRKPTCKKCHIEQAKLGKTECPHSCNHHVGSTCKTCGQED